MNTIATTSQPVAHRFDGMLKILRFNWPQYVVGALVMVVAAAVLLTVSLPAWMLGLGVVCIGLAAFWLLASLVVSHWVYDRSDVYDLRWLRRMLDKPVHRYANVHFGFDTGTKPARQAFPAATGVTWDCFDAQVIREASLRRARAFAGGEAGAPCDFRLLPADDASLDAVFLIFAAHELRDRGLRECFFAQLHRVVRPGGSVVIIEHARDLANFAAFGLGFVHFLPAEEWTRLAAVSGFAVVHERRITPFVRAIVLGR